MKLVLALFVLFTANVHSEVQCGNTKFCQIGFKPFQSRSVNIFTANRRVAERLKFLTKNNIVGVHNNSQFIDLVPQQLELCQDDTIGFLLDENNNDYTVSCLWTGATQYGQCQAVPAEYADVKYAYIPGDEWMKRLRKVRFAIGCKKTLEIPDGTQNGKKFNRTIVPDSELYICNERCVQGGIGYTASILIIITLAFSFFKNCVDGA